MANWKTTAAGIVTAIFGFILFSPQYFSAIPWIVDIAKFGAAGGLASLGLLAKDFNTHSTSAEVSKADTEAVPK